MSKPEMMLIEALWVRPSSRMRGAPDVWTRLLGDLRVVVPGGARGWYDDDVLIDGEAAFAGAVRTDSIDGVRGADGGPVTSDGVTLTTAAPARESVIRISEDDSRTFARTLRLRFAADAAVAREAANVLVRLSAPDAVRVLGYEFAGELAHAAKGLRSPLTVGSPVWVRGLHDGDIPGRAVVEHLDGGWIDIGADPAAAVQVESALQGLALPRSAEGHSPDRSGPALRLRPTGGDAEFQSRITGVELPHGGAAMPVYRVPDPNGADVEFHGHVWRDSSLGRQEVYLTTIGGLGRQVARANSATKMLLEEGWRALALQQERVLPADAVNEWHFDDEAVCRLAENALRGEGTRVRTFWHGDA